MGLPIYASNRARCSYICGNSSPVSQKRIKSTGRFSSSRRRSIAVESLPPERERTYFSGFIFAHLQRGRNNLFRYNDHAAVLPAVFAGGKGYQPVAVFRSHTHNHRVSTVTNADFTLFMQNSITGLCGAVLLFRCSVNKNLQDYIYQHHYSWHTEPLYKLRHYYAEYSIQ